MSVPSGGGVGGGGGGGDRLVVAVKQSNVVQPCFSVSWLPTQNRRCFFPYTRRRDENVFVKGVHLWRPEVQEPASIVCSKMDSRLGNEKMVAYAALLRRQPGGLVRWLQDGMGLFQESGAST